MGNMKLHVNAIISAPVVKIAHIDLWRQLSINPVMSVGGDYDENRQNRLMSADPHTTVAIAEWESEKLGKRGAENHRSWLRTSGIWDKLVLQTHESHVAANS